MTREFGTRPADLVAAIGPSIGACCYQVGDELLDAFRASAARARRDRARGSDAMRDGRLRLDLWTANRDQLVGRRASAPDRIFTAGLCTQTHAARLRLVPRRRRRGRAGWPALIRAAAA